MISHCGQSSNLRARKGDGSSAIVLVTANALAATVYLILAIIGRGLGRGKLEPSLLGRASGLLVLFLIIDAVWGAAMSARARWRRWDLYVFVLIGWLLAIWLGSGLASI